MPCAVHFVWPPNTPIVIVYGGINDSRFPALAAECVSLKADIIAVSTTPAAHAAKNATRSIPIVMLALGAPVESGVVTSPARPGGNVTGLSSMAPGLAVKRLELAPRD